MGNMKGEKLVVISGENYFFMMAMLAIRTVTCWNLIKNTEMYTVRFVVSGRRTSNFLTSR